MNRRQLLQRLEAAETKEEVIERLKSARDEGRNQGFAEFSAPWGPQQQSLQRQSILADDPEAIVQFTRDRSKLHMFYIEHVHRTKRLTVAVGAGLVLAAAALQVFAPTGRENLSHWIGAALVITAAGIVGFRSVWAKAPGFSVGAGRPTPSPHERLRRSR